MSSIYLLYYRDEFLPEPRLLIGFNSRERADEVCLSLSSKYEALKKLYFEKEAAESQWTVTLDELGMPQDVRFKVNPHRVTSFMFEVRELIVL